LLDSLLQESIMSKLTFRARTLDVGKPMAIYKADDLPELAAENAINRAVPALPTGMEKEEETEKHLQDILEAQTKGLVKKVAELVIPTPEVTEEQANHDSLYVGTFKQSRQYIHVQPLTADLDKPDYDMDEDDVNFFNADLKERRKFEVSLITFEDMIDRLEKNSGHNVVSLKEAKMLLKEDDDLILAVYDYWLNKRLESQQCLIPVVKSEPNRELAVVGQTPNPYIAFRRRTEKMQTRKNRNEEDSYMRMLKLRRDINRVVMILDMVKRREKFKKERLNLISDVYSKRFEAEDWDGSLLQQVQVQVQRPAKVSLHPYPLSSWMNVGSSDHSMPLKREKRIYRKRKHQRSGLMRNGISGLLRGDRTLLPLIPDPLSSDEGRGSAIGVKLLDSKPDVCEEEDGPFAFKRKNGVQYKAPLDDLCADIDRHEDREKYFSVMASLDLSRHKEYLGFCRRRVGRGGRVVLDRIQSKWETLEHSDMLYGDENRCLRPLTPENMRFKDWDPYRMRDQEVYAN